MGKTMDSVFTQLADLLVPLLPLPPNLPRLRSVGFARLAHSVSLVVVLRSSARRGSVLRPSSAPPHSSASSLQLALLRSLLNSLMHIPHHHIRQIWNQHLLNHLPLHNPLPLHLSPNLH